MRRICQLPVNRSETDPLGSWFRTHPRHRHALMRISARPCSVTVGPAEAVDQESTV